MVRAIVCFVSSYELTPRILEYMKWLGGLLENRNPDGSLQIMYVFPSTNRGRHRR